MQCKTQSSLHSLVTSLFKIEFLLLEMLNMLCLCLFCRFNKKYNSIKTSLYLVILVIFVNWLFCSFQVSWSQMTSPRSSADTIRSFLHRTVTSYQQSQLGLSLMIVIWVSLFVLVMMSPETSNYILHFCYPRIIINYYYYVGLH